MSSLENLYAYFKDFEGLRDELIESLDSWDMPTIVAFGSQNAGKSTLLERLAMIPLFPKGEGLCTRLAIRIRMRTDMIEKTIIRRIEVDRNTNQGSKETILSSLQLQPLEDVSLIVYKIMNELLEELSPKGQVSQRKGIRLDRLIEVELRRPKLPNLDILDIPGMVINPMPDDDPDLPKQTYDLVINTLKSLKDRAIFLAVREAGDDPKQSITVKVLDEIPEIKNACFGVLTKCDLMKDQLLTDRLQKSKEWQLGYGYFLVVNDPQASSLKEMAEYEKQYFHATRSRIEWLSNQQAGCEIILEKLNEGYHQYLKETWVYDTIEHLKMKTQNIKKQIQDLGPVFVKHHQAQDILRFEEAIISCLSIVEQKSLESLFPLITQKVNHEATSIKNLFNAKFKDEHGKFTIKQENLFQLISQQNHPIYQIKQTMKLVIQEIFKEYTIKVSSLLKEDIFGRKIISNLHIGRFENLVSMILSKLPIEKSKQDTLFQCEKEIDQWFVNDFIYENQNVVINHFDRLFDRLINRMILGLQKINWHFNWKVLLSNHAEIWVDSLSLQRDHLSQYHHQILMTIEKMIDAFGYNAQKNRLHSREKSIAQRVEKHKVNLVEFQMCYCPSGEFWIGSNDLKMKNTDWQRSISKHKLKMGKGFWMGETLVTQELWQAVMRWDNLPVQDNQLPIVNVNWYDCLMFCNQLSILENLEPCFELSNIVKIGKHIQSANVQWNKSANGYRLPTEAEWEYSAKANTELKYSGSNQIDEVAWYDENSRVNGADCIHAVKRKRPNAWGLYDMSGNVWEWCMNEWDKKDDLEMRNIEKSTLVINHLSIHTVRGGAFTYQADQCQVAYRNRYSADVYYGDIGLRLLKSEI